MTKATILALFVSFGLVGCAASQKRDSSVQILVAPELGLRIQVENVERNVDGSICFSEPKSETRPCIKSSSYLLFTPPAE